MDVLTPRFNTLTVAAVRNESGIGDMSHGELRITS